MARGRVDLVDQVGSRPGDKQSVRSAEAPQAAAEEDLGIQSIDVQRLNNLPRVGIEGDDILFHGGPVADVNQAVEGRQAVAKRIVRQGERSDHRPVVGIHLVQRVLVERTGQVPETLAIECQTVTDPLGFRSGEDIQHRAGDRVDLHDAPANTGGE